MRGVDTCTEALQPKVVDKAFGLQRFRCISHILQAGGHYIPAHSATDQARSSAMHVAQHDLSHASRRSCSSLTQYTQRGCRETHLSNAQTTEEHQPLFQEAFPSLWKGGKTHRVTVQPGLLAT